MCVLVVGGVGYVLVVDLVECVVIYLLVGGVVCYGWLVEYLDEMCMCGGYLVGCLVGIVLVDIVLLEYVVLCVDVGFEICFGDGVYFGCGFVVDVGVW